MDNLLKEIKELEKRVYNLEKRNLKFLLNSIIDLYNSVYKRVCIIDNSNNSNTLTNYPITITLDTASLISAGKMRPDGGDIRFLDLYSFKFLDYWVESGINTNNTKIWVKVPFIPAFLTRTIYLLYGNPNFFSQSNIANIFLGEIDGLVAAWNFDEGTGTTAKDTSGNNNNGTISGATWTNSGKFNKALSFDGVDDYVEAPAINERTVSMWINPAIQEQMQFYDGGITGTTNKAYQIGIYKPNGVGGSSTFDTTYGIYVVFWGNDVAVPFDAIKSGWHHVVVSWDGSTGLRVAIDGNYPSGYIWNGSTWTSASQPFTLPSTPTPDTSATTLIGKGRTAVWGIGSAYFKGYIDEVRIYNRALTSAEITDLYNNYGYSTTAYPGKVLIAKTSDPQPAVYLSDEF